MEEQRAIDSANGRIAIAWTVVEDLAMVLTLVALPALAGMLGGSASQGHAAPEGSLALLIALTAGKIVVFLALVAVAGPRVVPWILHQAARTGSHELFTLAVLAIALGIAYGAATFFGVSFALGAFCAGVVLSNSELSHRAAQESLAAAARVRGHLLRLRRHAVRPFDSRFASPAPSSSCSSSS